jgi:DNA-binding NarL/FixJ family response regulator
MADAPTRIVIVDDSQSYRNALCGILQKETNVKIVAEADNGYAGIQAVEKHSPDVVLMDISMPVMNGIDATRIITSQFSETKVIVLTMNNDPVYADSARKAGACLFLSKDCGKDKLFGAIKHCSRKQRR